jgi:hypothetical protein
MRVAQWEMSHKLTTTKKELSSMYSQKNALHLIPLACLFVLFGCDDSLNGTLQVQQPLSLITKKGKTEILQPGRLSMRLDSRERKSELSLKISTDGRRSKEIILKLPKDTKLPSYGDINLSAQKLGQNFDLVGRVESEETETTPVLNYETCSETHYEHVCSLVPIQGRDGRTYYERQCRNEPATLSGNREVITHDETTHTELDLRFVDPRSGQNIAVFDGGRVDTRTVTDHQGPCLIHRFR